MKNKGFTLIELMVAISIVAILSAIGLTLFTSVQKSARSAKRMEDLHAISLALEQYKLANGSYPITTNLTSGWTSECSHPWGLGNLSSDQVIPGLVPKYMQNFPSDPTMDKVNHKSCYLYMSNGNDYKLLDHDIAEFSAADYQKQPSLVDPSRMYWSWQMSTPDGRGW